MLLSRQLGPPSSTKRYRRFGLPCLGSEEKKVRYALQTSLMPLIIHTHDHPRRTGISIHVEEIIPALTDLGLQVAAFGEGLQSSTPQITEAEIGVHLKKNTPLLWHAHRPKSLRRGHRLRRRYPQVKVVWTHHGWRRPGWLTRLSLKKADALVALTQEGARQLEGPATVIGHGTSLPPESPRENKGRACALGVIGRIRPDKGHKELVEAFLSLKDDFPEWQLLFFGDVRPQHRRFAKGLLAQGEGRIHHQSYEVDRSAIYEGLSIVVMPSHAEGFSLVVPESMAYGCALLTSRLPHFGLLFKEEVHALSFEAGDSSDLQRQLRRLMEDPSLRSRLVQAANEHVVGHLRIEAEAEALAALYAEVLKS